MRVLVVDDETLINQYIVQCIKRADADIEIVAAVTSGKKALEVMEKEAVDLVFTDITMPRMDGIALLRHLRERYPSTDVIMLTCHDDFDYARIAVQNQAKDYILKSEISEERFRTLFRRLDREKKQQPAETVLQHTDSRMVQITRQIHLLHEQNSLYSEPIRKALDYIGLHYAEDISLNSVADVVYLNRDYLSRQFKKEIGINFSEYLMNLRMQKAHQMLETTNMRISDVAMGVGITNISYFSTVFHKTFGYKPNAVRKHKKTHGI